MGRNRQSLSSPTAESGPKGRSPGESQPAGPTALLHGYRSHSHALTADRMTHRNGPTSTVLTCRAPHPRASADARFEGRPHGIRLQVVPFEARPTYRRVTSWDGASPGCLAVRCHGCGEFTEYEIVGPVRNGTRAGTREAADGGAEAGNGSGARSAVSGREDDSTALHAGPPSSRTTHPLRSTQ